jgi:protein-tyrosine phosphatase
VNVLFVCTLNKARSVTAERLYRRTPGLSVRSAGIDERAAHQVNEADLAWADRVVVFEAKHERLIRDTFAGDLPEIIDVGVPDIFNAEDPALVAELVEVLTPVLGASGNPR